MARRNRAKTLGVHAKKKNISRFTVVGIVVLCIVVCAILTYKTVALRKQSVAYAAEIQTLQAQQEEQDEKEAALKDLKKKVKSDDYIEEVARDKLGLVNEGEIVFEPADKD